jgi:uncharacterized protein (TIGR03435 family)
MRKIAISSGVFAAILLVTTTPTFAQTSAPTADATHLTFDIVSIKPNHSGPGPTMIISPPDSDQVIVRHAPPREIIGEAYGIRLHDQIAGLPGWADSETYDIDAKIAESDAAAFHRLLPMQRNPMLQSVLTSRFHMVSHFETRQLPAYALVIAKSNKKTGPKLTEIQPGLLPSGLKDPGGINMSRTEITAAGADMPTLLHVLQLQVGRPVIDRTGLTGHYNFVLKWTSDQDSASPDAGPSIFTAVQEQLGLKLEPVKAPIPILIVDHIERPSEN